MRRGYIIWIADKGVVNIRVDRANSIASVAFGNKNFPIFTSKVFLTSSTNSCRYFFRLAYFFFSKPVVRFASLRFSRSISSNISSSPILMNLSTRLSECFAQFQSSWSWYTITKLIYYKVVKKVLLWKSKVHMPMKVYVCRLNEFTKFSTNSLDSKFEKIDDPSFNPDCSI